MTGPVLAAVSFRQGRTYRLAATRANGQPAPSRNRGLTEADSASTAGEPDVHRVIA